MRKNWPQATLQILPIIISLISVGMSIFIAYQTNQTARDVTKINGETNKNNEIETRIYEQRYQLYKTVGEALTRFNENESKSGSLQKAKDLRKELRRIGYQTRIIGTPYIICTYSNLLLAIDGYVNFIENESPAHAFTDYGRDVIPAIFLFEKSIRDTLLQSESVELSLIQSENTKSFYNEALCLPGQGNDIPEDQYR